MITLLWLSAATTAAVAQAISRVPLINTIAGNGAPGYTGDGGPATSAELNNPGGMVIDVSGNLYIADVANNRVREVVLGTGMITTIAGTGTAAYSGDGGPAAGAALHGPASVTVDTAGNLYIADQGNNVIRKVSASGTIATVAGNNAAGYSGDNGLATNATLYAPAGVAIDSAGNIYIADAGNNRIREVNTSGIITTIAGNGNAGYSGDNGPAASATLNKPSAVVEGTGGSLYIVDTGNHAIRQVNATGAITTVAGNGTAGYSGNNGPATSATLNTPFGLNIDSAGNLYIADSNNNVIRMVTAAGVITTVAGNGTPGYSGDGGTVTSAILNNPRGVAFDAQGNLYISDQANNRMREVNTPAGSVLFPATAVSAASVALTIPLLVNTPGTTISGITVPVSQGGKQEYTVTAPGCALNTALNGGALCNVIVTFTPGYPGLRPVPLQVASSAGTFTFGMTGTGTAPQVALSPGIINTIASTLPPNVSATSGLGALYGPEAGVKRGVVVDSVGNLYVGVEAPEGHIGAEAIAEIAAGTGIATNVLSPMQNADFGFALDSAGNLYAASTGNNCVYKVAPGAGAATVVAGICGGYGDYNGGFGGDNGPAVAAQLNAPAAVAVDSAGNLYIADSSNNRIRKIAAVSGIITTIAGNGAAGATGDNGPAVAAELNDPIALALDNAGNLYIVDGRNYRVRKLAAATGNITTVVGNGAQGSSGDNGPATSAELTTPVGVAVDAAGDLYVADATSNIVRMVNAAGIITTVAGTTAAGESGDGGAATDATLLVYGVALDSAGNLYLPGEAIRTVNVSAGTLTFPSAQIGLPATQTVAVTNIGNALLSFAVPASGQNPSISTGFSLDSATSCPQLALGSQTATLASGAACSLSVDFAPSTTAALTGTVSIADNSLGTNGTQTVLLNAGAGETVATTTTVNVANPYFGETQVSATVLATAGTLTPVGSVVFTVDGAPEAAIAVNASGIAALSSAVSDALAIGSHTIGATYTSSSLGFGNSVATRIFTVSQVPPSVTIAPSTSSLTVAPGGSVTDTLTFTSVGGYAGTLQFSCAQLPQSATCSFQPATLTLSSTGGPQTSVVTIQTAGTTAALQPAEPFAPAESPIRPAAAFWAPGLLVVGLAGRKRKFSPRGLGLVIVLALLAGTWMVNGCSGGGSGPASRTPSAPVTPATPAGTSTVLITASASGSAVQSFSLTLTVQ